MHAAVACATLGGIQASDRAGNRVFMAVEFEKLTETIQSMGEMTLRRENNSRQLLEMLRGRLHIYAVAWEWIDHCLAHTAPRMNGRLYRGARPLGWGEPLDLGVDPLPAGPATLIAVDGSQRLPSRHDPFLYYLLNIGAIIYPHGGAAAPLTSTWPELGYPGDDLERDVEAEFTVSQVSIRRDLAEIATLAQITQTHRPADIPVLALLDQRLQYWPIGSNDATFNHRAVADWLKAMQQIEATGAWLAGYIDRPGTSAVVTLLYTLGIDQPDFDERQINRRQPVTDADLYRTLLAPGQRSPLYQVVQPDEHYARFEEAGQALCFFYFKPPQTTDLARVDIPLWVARQPQAVAHLHALLVEQCHILGRYPYVLTRADEIAVVQPKDQEYLDNLIALEMQRRGVTGDFTGKQWGKEWTRAGLTRYSL